MRVSVWLLVPWLAACAAPVRNSTTYDFGLSAQPVAVSDPLPASLAIAEVQAPAWLASDGIVYRLAYENAARPHVYSQNRWVAPPPALLTQRLQETLANVAAGGVTPAAAGVTPDYLLRVELEEFSQVFDARDASRATVRVRASLIDPRRGELLGQRDFHAERPAAPDAAGAARSLREASDAVLHDIAGWLAAGAGSAGAPARKNPRRETRGGQDAPAPLPLA